MKIPAKYLHNILPQKKTYLKVNIKA